MCRCGSFYSVFFGFYMSVKDLGTEPKNPVMREARKFGIGFVGSCFASVFQIPFDVVKTRIQVKQDIKKV